MRRQLLAFLNKLSLVTLLPTITYQLTKLTYASIAKHHSALNKSLVHVTEQEKSSVNQVFHTYRTCMQSGCVSIAQGKKSKYYPKVLIIYWCVICLKLGISLLKNNEVFPENSSGKGGMHQKHGSGSKAWG